MPIALLLGLAIVIAGPSGDIEPSQTAIDEIPDGLLQIYVDASSECDGLPWQVVAAIGFVESGHARGTADPTTGGVEPHILGPALDGSNGTMRLVDANSSDGWVHAQGPMQFLPSTWARWARLAPGRPQGSDPSPHNAWDSIFTAVRYLCRDAGQVLDLEAAIFSYNHSAAYVKAVLAKASDYGLAFTS